MKNYRRFLNENETFGAYVLIDRQCLVIADCFHTIRLNFHSSIPENREAARNKLKVLREALDILEYNMAEEL